MLLGLCCGRMLVEGNKVVADPRRGRLLLCRREEDEAGHLAVLWGGEKEASGCFAAVFPAQDAEFRHLARVKGRVYALLFTASGCEGGMCSVGPAPKKKLLFWMAEQDPSQDADLAEQFNGCLEGVRLTLSDDPSEDVALSSSNSSNSSASSHASSVSHISTESPDLYHRISSSLSAAMEQVMGGRAAAAAGTPGALQSALASAMAAGLGPTPSSARAAVDPRVGPTLLQLLDPEALLPRLQDEGVRQRLREQLPAELRDSPGELEFTLSVPQLQEALSRLDMALRSGSLQTVFEQLGLSITDAQGDSVIKLLVSALVAQAQRSRQLQDDPQ
ncbi:MAG: hypothetical protein Q8P67_22150 [archaeon]|nr:hypothetical protein [archaeon]